MTIQEEIESMEMLCCSYERTICEITGWIMDCFPHNITRNVSLQPLQDAFKELRMCEETARAFLKWQVGAQVGIHDLLLLPGEDRHMNKCKESGTYLVYTSCDSSEYVPNAPIASRLNVENIHVFSVGHQAFNEERGLGQLRRWIK